MDRPPLPLITPMAPTLIAQPFHRDGWVYEEKYDGWRMLAYKEGRGVRLMSRNGRDLTPESCQSTAGTSTMRLVCVWRQRCGTAPADARDLPGGDRTASRAAAARAAGAAGPEAVAIGRKRVRAAVQLATAAVRQGEAAEIRVDAHPLVSCRVVRRGYSPSASSWAGVSAIRGME